MKQAIITYLKEKQRHYEIEMQEIEKESPNILCCWQDPYYQELEIKKEYTTEILQVVMMLKENK